MRLPLLRYLWTAWETAAKHFCASRRTSWVFPKLTYRLKQRAPPASSVYPAEAPLKKRHARPRKNVWPESPCLEAGNLGRASVDGQRKGVKTLLHQIALHARMRG